MWVTGGQALPGFAKTICDSAAHQARFNMASVWWELPDFPAAWAQCAESFDAIVAGSPFLRESWANAVSGVPVFDGLVLVMMLQSVVSDRKRFALPTDATLVYMGFDAGSDPVRKNPFAVVAAFKQAFLASPDVRLVIKVNNPKVEGRLDAADAASVFADRRRPRVMLIAERLTHADLLTLYASCDIVISLHRSEGLGLIPLEAMLLGKPVICHGLVGQHGLHASRLCCAGRSPAGADR
ncbi:MAG: glycosyltransferase [Betaproteobacteria bacterium]|nr:glycosyltransferase [Betaproteobacteria bacterium]